MNPKPNFYHVSDFKQNIVRFPWGGAELNSALKKSLRLFLIMFSCLLSKDIYAQCDTPDPSEALFDYYISILPSQANHRLLRSANDLANIPIYFTVIRNTDGSSYNDIDNAKVDLTLGIMNQKYAQAGLSFYRLGDVNYIDWSPLYSGQYTYLYSNAYAYISTAINVIVQEKGNSSSSQPQLLLNPDYYTIEDNTIFEHGVGLDGNFVSTTADFIHEVGHIFGLLHTHGATTLYQNPPSSNQVDHPYNGTNNLKRELQIRIKTLGKNFENPNWDIAGDLCGDTYPSVTDVQVFFPGGSIWCPYSGTYLDYNNDPITPQESNYMSYFACRNDFTDCQYDKASFIYDTYRQYQLTDAYVINYKSNVYFENTIKPIKNAVFEWIFSNDVKKWRATSGHNGKLEGILYKPNLKVTSYTLGSIVEQTMIGNTPYFYLSGFTVGEWKEKLSSFDLYVLNNHLLHIKSLKNGYKKLAADLDKNHAIQPADLKLLSNLLVGKITKLTAYRSPYVFVPEFIPNNYNLDFDSNPFSLVINGQQVSNAEYIDPSYQFTINDGLAAGAGFDGVKIGKVSDENTVGNEEPGTINPNLINQMVQLQNGQLYKLDFKFENAVAAAYQLKFQIDTSKVTIINYYHPLGTLLGDSLNTYIEGNKLTTVWYNAVGDSTNIVNTQNLFSVLVLPKINTNTNDIIQIKNALNSSGIYGANGNLMAGNVKMQAAAFNPNQKEKVNEVNNSIAFLYPNPTKNTINLSFDLDSKQEVEYLIFDISGKLQFSKILILEAGKQNLSIDNVAKLANGTYLAVLKTLESNYSQLFIKQ